MSMAQGGIKFLSTITPQTGQKIIRIPLDNALITKYKTFILLCDLLYTPGTAKEWVYFGVNTTSYTGARYVELLNEDRDNGRVQFITSAEIDSGNIKIQSMSNVTAHYAYNVEQNDNYLCIMLYTYTFDEGTNVKLYGME